MFKIKLFKWKFWCCQLAKILKNQLYGFEHFQSHGVSPVFLLLDLDLNFLRKTFEVVNLTSKGWNNKFKNIVRFISHFLIQNTFLDLFFSTWQIYDFLSDGNSNVYSICHHLRDICKTNKMPKVWVWKWRLRSWKNGSYTIRLKCSTSHILFFQNFS